ncbi:DUF374 domain-containing protein [bacterium]|nr:MAG: DUF374 domain-containing protein [bacterium]
MGNLKYRWRERRPEIVSGLLYLILRLITKTLRVRVEGEPEPEGSAIFCGWHGRSFVFANHFRKRGIWVLISQSRDGEMQARLFGRLGFQLIRGSTGRGGVRALIEAVRVLRKGEKMAMTPDGPRGPSGVCQIGVIAMAQKSGAMLVPTGVSCRPRWRVKSWDRYIIPKPFGRGLVLIGEGFRVPPDADEATLEEYRLRLEREIDLIEAEADRRLGIASD